MNIPLDVQLGILSSSQLDLNLGAQFGIQFGIQFCLQLDIQLGFLISNL